MFSRFFIDRPIFASVCSIVITLGGSIALFTLPIAQYPEITPPTVEVSAIYPGANAQVVADTVAAPLEQQVNGVENMMYMSSQCTNDGVYTLTITFKVGTDLNIAQVLVQNRVALATPVLPPSGAAARRAGQEKVARGADDHQFVFARRQPQQSRSEQLRHDPDPRRVGPLARRGRHHLSRPARLQHATLARSRQAGLAQHHGFRRDQRRPAAKRAGGGRRNRPTPGAQWADVSIHDDHRSAGSPTSTNSARWS